MSESIRLETVGQRVYFRAAPFAAKGAIKALGAHWDSDERCWWIGTRKRPEAEALLAELASASKPAEVTPTPASAVLARELGLDPETPAAVVADRLEELGRGAEAARVRRGPQEDPREVRLTGRGTYQGRSYYLGSYTRDGAKVRILTLPRPDGSYLDRWVPAAEVRVTRTYEPRQVWDGRRYSGRTVTQHQTLGGIAAFLRDQQDPATRRGPCTECGTWGPSGEPCRECGGEGSHS